MENLSRSNFRVLPEESVLRIHQASLELLSRVGIRVEDPGLRERLHGAGCSVEKEMVRLDPELVMAACSGLSQSLTLACPWGGRVDIGPGRTATHTAGGMPFILDSVTGERRYARTEDLIRATWLINELDQLDIDCGFVYLDDAPPQINQVKQCEILLRYSSKPFFTLAATPGEARYVAELFKAAQASGPEEGEGHAGIIGISPESPLFFPKVITDSIEIIVSAGIPVAMLPAPIIGFSAPITLAGGLVQQNASMLAFNLIASRINPATPVIYGARLAFANMRIGNSLWGLPDVGRAGACAVQLADFYGFPSDVYGLSSNSCTPDGQASYEKAANGLSPLLAGASLISGSGSLASLTVASLEQLVIDDEIIRVMRRLVQDLKVDEETLAVEAITAALEGKSYLLQEHTVNHLRTGEVFDPGLGFAGQWDEWDKDDRRDLAQRAKARAAEILSSDPEEICGAEAAGWFDSIIRAAEAELVV